MTAVAAAIARTRPAAEAPVPWSVPTLAAGLFATGFGLPRAGGFTVADVVIGAFIVLAALEMAARRDRPRQIVLAVLFPILLVLCGSLIGALGVGLTDWVVYDLIRDLGAAATLLAVLQVFDRAPVGWFRFPARALVAIVVIVAMQLVFVGQETLRAKATFPNPNVAGHFMATAFMALLVLPVSRRFRIGGLIAAGVGVVATGTFVRYSSWPSGWASWPSAPPGGSAWRPARARHRDDRHHRAPGRRRQSVSSSSPSAVSPPDTTLPIWIAPPAGVHLGGAAIDQVIDRPEGIGPGSSRNLEVLRAATTRTRPTASLWHSCPSGAHSGCWGWWRGGPPCGALPPGAASVGRCLRLVVASLVREAFYYRHLWLLLALVVTYERTLAVARTRGTPRSGPMSQGATRTRVAAGGSAWTSLGYAGQASSRRSFWWCWPVS